MDIVISMFALFLFNWNMTREAIKRKRKIGVYLHLTPVVQ
jgi:hypothetical protein